MPTHFERLENTDGNNLVLTDIRLALSPHDEQLRREWKERTNEELGSGDTFFAIYLEGDTDTPDPADPDTQSVSGYSVHVLRRHNDPNPFRLEVDPGAPAGEQYKLTIPKNTDAFFFKTRTPDTKVFDASRSIQEHADILDDLKSAEGPYRGGRTSTGDEALSHPNPTKTILQISF